MVLINDALEVQRLLLLVKSLSKWSLINKNRKKPVIMEGLKNRIIEASQRIKIHQLLNVRRHFYEYLGHSRGHCLTAKGGHFEQFI